MNFFVFEYPSCRLFMRKHPLLLLPLFLRFCLVKQGRSLVQGAYKSSFFRIVCETVPAELECGGFLRR